MHCAADIFVEFAGLCISQSNAVSGALVAATASLATTGWKLWSDRSLKRARNAFERLEREAREAFERDERKKREDFETQQCESANITQQIVQSLRQQFEKSEREGREDFEQSERRKREEFETRQANANVEAQARIQKEVQSYIQLEKWREESWQRNLSRLEQASQQLSRTASGLESLVDEGPSFSDLRMIQETARVLDVFGDFQTSVSHFALPTEISDSANELISHITRMLLTLSPSQEVRQSAERQRMLAPLKDELRELANMFMQRCGDFERDPTVFLRGAGAA